MAGGETYARRSDISLEVLFLMLLALPVLAAGMLGLFAVLLRPLRKIPAHEYEQLVRAPAWLVTMIGVGITLLSLVALVQVARGDAQVFYGSTRGVTLLMGDAYTFWGSALLGAVLATAAWAPAARRTLVPRALPYFLLLLLLTWCALLLLFSVQLPLTVLSWLLLLGGVVVLWAWLYHPPWRWEFMEVPVVLGLAGVLGCLGLSRLHAMAPSADLSGLWNVLLASSASSMHLALLLVLLGWLGPAVYLPWWVWRRSEEVTLIWTPAALLLAVSGVLALIRLVFFAFPVGGGGVLAQLPGVDQLTLIKRLISWVAGWGIIALLLSAGWLVVNVGRWRRAAWGVLQPLPLAAAGLLLLGLAAGLFGLVAEVGPRRDQALNGLLWLLPTWAGALVICLTAGSLLSALTLRERTERRVLQASVWGALAALVALPPSSGFRGVLADYPTWRIAGMSPRLVLLLLVLLAIGAGLQLPAWCRRRVAETPRAGTGWGIIAPFLFALLLVTGGLLAGPLSPLFTLIRQSLLQR